MANKFCLYEHITNKLIKEIESGTLPWLKPWQGGSVPSGTLQHLPFNGATGNNYNGINILLLSICNFQSNAWYTLNQAKKLGGKLKKGAESQQAVYWQIVEKEDKEGNVEKLFFLKYWKVFNFEQFENLPKPKAKPCQELKHNSLHGIASNMNVKLTHGGNVASYSPLHDVVTMPLQSDFKAEKYYNGTLLHELSHATGHKSRCNRDMESRFGNNAYAMEELIAELSSAFTAAHLGIEPTLQHNASYLKSWLDVLKSDKRAIITASSKAQKASEFILEKAGMVTQKEKQAA